MRNSKVYIGFIVLFLFVFSFKIKKNIIKTNIDNISLELLQKEKYLNDSSLKEIIRLNPKWFNSWNWEKESLTKDYFKPELETTKSIIWEEYNVNDLYLKQYDTLLIASNQFAIDLYSYNTLIEKEDKDILIEFDVDSKVYVMNRKHSKRCEVAHSGSYEIIEDANWLNDKVILLGYTNEVNNKHIPFIWIIDFKKEKTTMYKYFKAYEDLRENFFFIKYPNTKLREF